jgi:hypothetical protein
MKKFAFENLKRNNWVGQEIKDECSYRPGGKFFIVDASSEDVAKNVCRERNKKLTFGKVVYPIITMLK